MAEFLVFEREPLLSVRDDMFTLADSLADNTDAYRVAVEQVITTSIRENFMSGGRPKWEPLAEGTIKHSRRPAGARPLIVTGALMNRGSSPEVWRIDEDGAFLDPTLLDAQFYGVFHQDGTAYMPERPWAILQPQDIDKIQEVFGNSIDAKMESAGFDVRAGGIFRRFFGRLRRRGR